MSWLHVPLHNLRRRAGLVPLPPFLRDYGNRLIGTEWVEYVDHRYFSPAALHWADEAMRFLVEHGSLPSSDMQALELVWQAMRAGLKPTDGQRERYALALEHAEYERQKAQLHYDEWRGNGFVPGDDELETGDEVMGAEKLFKKYAMQHWNLKDDAVDKRIRRRRDAHEALWGTR